MQSATTPANLGQGRNVQQPTVEAICANMFCTSLVPHLVLFLSSGSQNLRKWAVVQARKCVIGAAIRIPGTCKEHRTCAMLGVVFRSADVAEQRPFRVSICAAKSYDPIVFLFFFGGSRNLEVCT